MDNTKWGTPAGAGEVVACGNCGGTGWMVRDPDIGTDQECFVCDGSGGYSESATSQPTQAQVVNQANRPFIVRLAEDFAEKCVTAGYVTTKAASYGRLMDEALSTKAQAGAVPLTKEQAASLCKMGPVYAPDGQVVRTPEQYRRELEGAKLAGIRTAERAHGITGGQHGAE